MKKTYIIVVLVLSIFFAGCTGIKNKGKKVLCGNAMVLSLVKDCDAGVEAVTLIPAEMCPGSFDLRPEDAQKIESSEIFIIQPFQKPLAEKVLKINPKLIVGIIYTKDMTVPENYFNGLVETAAVLEKTFPQKSEEFINNYNKQINVIRDFVIKDSDFIEKIRAKKIGVLVSSFQEASARHLGFDVIGVFEGPEMLKASDTGKLIDKAKKEGAMVILSNMTGTHDKTADILNAKLKIKKVVLICFPGETKAGSMFMNLWSFNISQLKAALGQ